MLCVIIMSITTIIVEIISTTSIGASFGDTEQPDMDTNTKQQKTPISDIVYDPMNVICSTGRVCTMNTQFEAFW